MSIAPMTATSTTGLATSNDTGASAKVSGNTGYFEDENVSAQITTDGTVVVKNKATGEEYKFWGDPHLTYSYQDPKTGETKTVQMDIKKDSTFEINGTKFTFKMSEPLANGSTYITDVAVKSNDDFGAVFRGVAPSSISTAPLTCDAFNRLDGGKYVDEMFDDGVRYEERQGTTQLEGTNQQVQKSGFNVLLNDQFVRANQTNINAAEAQHTQTPAANQSNAQQVAQTPAQQAQAAQTALDTFNQTSNTAATAVQQNTLQSLPENMPLNDMAQAVFDTQKARVIDLLKKVKDDPNASFTERSQASNFLGQLGSGKKLSYRQIGMMLALIAGELQKKAADLATGMGTDTSKIAPADTQQLTEYNMDIKMLTDLVAEFNKTIPEVFRNLLKSQ